MKKDFYRKLQEKLNNNEEVYLMTIISEAYEERKIAGQKLFTDGKYKVIEDSTIEDIWEIILENVDYNKSTYSLKLENGLEVFVEYLVSKPHLVICGGGHIALPLCNIGKLLDFKVTIIDDREEFANFDRFAMADNVICGNFNEVLEEIKFNKNTYFVIVTRGHKGDRDCLESVIDKGYEYVGMIGSKGKVAKVVSALLGQGYSKELIDKVHTPIGLDIGSQTPAEVAVSIAGEIILEKNKKKASEFEEEILDTIVNNRGKSVLTTIVEKRGSSPRGVGTKMLICEDGSFLGTIGGGAVENYAYNRALELVGNNDNVVEVYDLSNSKAATLGMICGGTVKVVFECI